jgi:2-desacetyl-2-hydroxyethyl bacteriochlorophyllide A dehydrogenase
LKALLKTKKGKGYLEIEDVPIPGINDNEVLIKVHYSGICGTDIHIFSDQFPIYYPPVILGHEFSGEIVHIGGKVTSWKVGDRVVAECQSLVCGKCRYCRTGHPEACSSKRSPGWGINGSFAEYIKMPSWLLHKIPDNVSYTEAALTEPAAVCSQAIYSRSKLETGDFVVVLGSGPIGIIIAKMAIIGGASKVLITGIDQDEQYRFKLAKKMGIEYTVNVNKVNLEEIVNELTNGLGADLVVEATGVESAINQAFEIVRKLGKITVVGIPGQNKSNIKWLAASFKALDVSFSFSSQYQDWVRVLKLFENRSIDLTKLITHEFELDNWKIAFEKAIDCQGGKVLFKIN